jgi:tRNA(Ile)-lysidine synthase
VEALLLALERAGAKKAASHSGKLKQTLAGAMISLAGGQIRIEPAPPRRRRG